MKNQCRECKGKGRVYVKKKEYCASCHGSGRVACHRSGRVETVPCCKCRGIGWTMEWRWVTCEECGGLGGWDPDGLTCIRKT